MSFLNQRCQIYANPYEIGPSIASFPYEVGAQEICSKSSRHIMKNNKWKTNIIDHNRKTCNCRQPTICPQDGNCLSSSIIYKATVS